MDVGLGEVAVEPVLVYSNLSTERVFMWYRFKEEYPIVSFIIPREQAEQDKNLLDQFKHDSNYVTAH